MGAISEDARHQRSATRPQLPQNEPKTLTTSRLAPRLDSIHLDPNLRLR